MARQFAQEIVSKNSRTSIIGLREVFKGKELVNLREFVSDGDDLVATKAGFTVPVEDFQRFFKELRKWGRAAGLLPNGGDDPKKFEMKSLDEVANNEQDEDEEEDGDDTEEEVTAKKAKDKSSKKKKKIATKEETKAKKSKGKAEKAEVKAKAKKAAKADKEDADEGDAFNIKAFKKAIKAAVKDEDKGADVLAMYKGSRKKLKDVLPKHAVNALEKALANKKDESFLAKAIAACEKHIVEKDFTL